MDIVDQESHPLNAQQLMAGIKGHPEHTDRVQQLLTHLRKTEFPARVSIHIESHEVAESLFGLRIYEINMHSPIACIALADHQVFCELDWGALLCSDEHIGLLAYNAIAQTFRRGAVSSRAA